MSYFYDYRFVQNLTQNLPSDSVLNRKLYSFKSSKTNYVYHVILDKCKYDVYVIKFYLKSHKNSKKKYNLITNLKEPRTVLRTCMEIALQEVFYKNPNASFGFVASNKVGEDYKCTKRYKVYERFITSYIGTETFAHYKYEDYSTYLLIPTILIDRDPNLSDKIFNIFQEHNFCEIN